MRARIFLATLVVAGWAGAARADQCEAIPEQGAIPAHLGFGATFSGPIVEVIDGDSLCVAVGEGPSNWVEVRLADFYAPEMSEANGRHAKAVLERIAAGQHADCVAGLKTYDRIAARCSIGGTPIGDLMRTAGAAEGGNATASDSRRSQPPRQTVPVPSGTFRNCAEARAAGRTPLYRGQPGYGPHMDGDGDGVACEPYRGRR